MLLLTFRAAESLYAVDVGAGRRGRARGSSSGALPHAPAYLAGLLRYRGGVVPVVDLGAAARRRRRAATGSSTRIILVDAGRPAASSRPATAPPSVAERASLGLIAERVSDVRVDRRAGRAAPVAPTVTSARCARPVPRARSSEIADERLAPARSDAGAGGPRGARRDRGWTAGRTDGGRHDATARPARSRRCWPSGSGSTRRRSGAGLIARAVRARMAALGLGDRSDYAARSCAARRPSCRRWSRRWWSRRAGSSATSGRSRCFREHARGGLAGRPGAAAAAGPERPLRGGRGAVLDRDRRCSRSGLPPERFRVDAVDVSARRLARRDRGRLRPERVPGRRPGVPRRATSASSAGALRARPGGPRRRVRFHQGNLLDPALLAGRAAVRRGLLPEPADLPRRPGRGPARSRRSTGCWPTAACSSSATPTGSTLAGRAPGSRPPASRGRFAYRGKAAPAPVVPVPPRSLGRDPRDARPRLGRRATPAPIASGAGTPADGSGSRPGSRTPEGRRSGPAAKPRPPLGRLLERGRRAGRSGAARRGDRGCCERAICRVRGRRAAAYFLLGMIRQAAGDRRAGRGVLPQGGLPRPRARRGAAGPGPARRAAGRRRRGRGVPPPGRAGRGRGRERR